MNTENKKNMTAFEINKKLGALKMKRTKEMLGK